MLALLSIIAITASTSFAVGWICGVHTERKHWQR